jgi:hypothetical protein
MARTQKTKDTPAVVQTTGVPLKENWPSTLFTWVLPEPELAREEELQPAVAAVEPQPAEVLRLQAALRPGQGRSRRSQTAMSPLRGLQARLVISCSCSYAGIPNESRIRMAMW